MSLGAIAINISDPSLLEGSVCEGACCAAYITFRDGEREVYLRSTARRELVAALRRAADKIEQADAEINA